jgi:putative hydrolase of the HAD superfamily
VSEPRRGRPAGLLIDLDGVLRRFDPDRLAAIEAEHRLPSGSLTRTALDPALLIPAVTGRTTHARWVAEVAERIGADTGDADAARAAVASWAGYRGEVDADVLAFVRAVRGERRPVALATNSTDRLDDDLATLGLAGEVDAVVSSRDLGVAKPHPDFFRAACAVLGLPAGRVLLLDDTERFVAGAREAGLLAHRYAGHGDLAYLRVALGLADAGKSAV